MRRLSLAVLIVLLAVMVASVATAGGFVLDSIFAQVYSEKVTVVDAGVGTYATYHAECQGPQTATAKEPGNLQAPRDKYGVSAETRWIKVVTCVKDVKNSQVKSMDQAFVTDDGVRTTAGIVCKITSSSVIWIDGWSLPCLVRLSPVVVQTASKKDRKILMIFTLTDHFARENSTDVFIDPRDMTEELDGLIPDQPQLGLDHMVLENYTALSHESEFRRLFRSYVYGRFPMIGLSMTVGPYTIASDGRAQRVQGQQQQQYEAGLAKVRSAYEDALADARKTIEGLTQKLNSVEASQPKVWSLKVGTSQTGAWHVWVCRDGKTTEGPLYVADQVIQFNGAPGTYWVEVQPYGSKFEGWHRYDVTSAGQQFNFTEVK